MPSVLPEDMCEKMSGGAFVGQVLGSRGEPSRVESIGTGLGFTLVGLCTVCLPLCV